MNIHRNIVSTKKKTTMYETRQHKEKVSRQIEVGGGARQRMKKCTRTIAQLMSIVRAGFPDYEYTVNSSDYGKGSETDPSTQTHVNGLGYNGGTIDLMYETGTSPINHFTGNAVTVSGIPNYAVQIPGRSLWDAGHALPRQIGGIGNDTNHVFPQSPPINQGNRNALFNTGISNYQWWRTHETRFAHQVLFSGYGKWRVHVN